jgi:plastocyanin
MKIVRGAWTLAALAFVACGGGEKAGTNTGNAGARPAPGAPAGSTAASAAAAPQPATGKTWDVKMFGDASGYRYDPVSITIKRGDAIRWTIVSGSPHNVTFWADSIPTGAAAVLGGNMAQTIAPMTGPLLMTPGQSYTVSFGGAPAGTYRYYCTPHLALGMKGRIVVQ